MAALSASTVSQADALPAELASIRYKGLPGNLDEFDPGPYRPERLHETDEGAILRLPAFCYLSLRQRFGFGLMNTACAAVLIGILITMLQMRVLTSGWPVVVTAVGFVVLNVVAIYVINELRSRQAFRNRNRFNAAFKRADWAWRQYLHEQNERAQSESDAFARAQLDLADPPDGTTVPAEKRQAAQALVYKFMVLMDISAPDHRVAAIFKAAIKRLELGDRAELIVSRERARLQIEQYRAHADQLATQLRMAVAAYELHRPDGGADADHELALDALQEQRHVEQELYRLFTQGGSIRGVATDLEAAAIEALQVPGYPYAESRIRITQSWMTSAKLLQQLLMNDQLPLEERAEARDRLVTIIRTSWRYGIMHATDPQHWGFPVKVPFPTNWNDQMVTIFGPWPGDYLELDEELDIDRLTAFFYLVLHSVRQPGWDPHFGMTALVLALHALDVRGDLHERTNPEERSELRMKHATSVTKKDRAGMPALLTISPNE